MKWACLSVCPRSNLRKYTQITMHVIYSTEVYSGFSVFKIKLEPLRDSEKRVYLIHPYTYFKEGSCFLSGFVIFPESQYFSELTFSCFKTFLGIHMQSDTFCIQAN